MGRGLGRPRPDAARTHAAAESRLAAQINPSSSVLRCYLGMALAKKGDPDAALQQLSVAIERDPRNPLAIFERAHVLLQYGRLEDALHELEALKVLHCQAGSELVSPDSDASDGRSVRATQQCSSVPPPGWHQPGTGRMLSVLVRLSAQACAAPVQDQAPMEPSVWWLLAKVLKRLNRKSGALTALNAALDLQPPASDVALIKAALDKLHLEADRSGDEDEI